MNHIGSDRFVFTSEDENAGTSISTIKTQLSQPLQDAVVMCDPDATRSSMEAPLCQSMSDAILDRSSRETPGQEIHSHEAFLSNRYHTEKIDITQRNWLMPQADLDNSQAGVTVVIPSLSGPSHPHHVYSRLLAGFPELIVIRSGVELPGFILDITNNETAFLASCPRGEAT